MSVFEFPMMFPADGASLVGRVYRNVDELVTPQPAVVVTGSWLTVKEQMARTYALRLAEQGGPKQIEWTAGSQIDFYDQGSQVTKAVALAAFHFRNTLGLTESDARSVGART